ncbi:hypothetical protein D3C80_1673800 [compost metagenome]
MLSFPVVWSLMLVPMVKEVKSEAGRSRVLTKTEPPPNSPGISGVKVFATTTLSTRLVGIISKVKLFLLISVLGITTPFKVAEV